MKIIHTSDIHFGVENYAKIDTATGLSTRLLDFVRAFERIVDYAIAENADALIFTGDAYKNRDPNPTHQREFARLIRKLTQAGVEVFLLTGNHDLPNMSSRAHSLEIFDTLAVPGVTVARKIWTHVLNTRSGPLQVVALPWVTRSVLFAREENRSLSMRELDELMQQRIADAVSAQIATLDKDIPAILAAHTSIDGATVGSEQMIMLGSDLSLPRSLVNRPDALQYVALGHIHKHQDLSVEGELPILYAGSIERVDFGERNDPKGFIEVEIAKTAGGFAAHPAFKPLPARIFYEYLLDIRQYGADLNTPGNGKKNGKIATPDIFTDLQIDPANHNGLSLTELVIKRLETQAAQDEAFYIAATGDKQTQIKRFAGAVFRLKLLMNAEQEAALRLADLQKTLDKLGISYLAGISKEVERTDRVRLAGVNAAELTPEQLLRLYFEERQLDSKRIDSLMEHASRLMYLVPHEC